MDEGGQTAQTSRNKINKSSGVMHSIANNTVLSTRKLLRVDIKVLITRKSIIIMHSDEC